jgi:quinol-cytochrome oxidoreductase complex cytochrome b subunit
MFFIAVYIHIFRGLYYGSYKAPREVLWLLGIVIYLLMMATGFLGYTLPWGQMSFWGATVITNFFSSIDQVIPGVGSAITQWLWGSFAVDNSTLQRFFSLHYLLPFVIAGVVVLHIWALHVPGNNNPLGIDVKGPADSVPFHPYYTIKDLFALALFVLFFSYFIFFAPNFLGHADNYIPADRLVTPPHIVPEWYYLPLYAILRSVPDKLIGVLLMFGAIVVWAFLPWLDRSHVRSNKFRPMTRQLFYVLLAVIWILGMLGAQTPDGNFEFYFGLVLPISKLLLSQICTIYYFLHFLVITPIVSTMEKPLPVPESIATAVLAKNGAGSPAKANG